MKGSAPPKKKYFLKLKDVCVGERVVLFFMSSKSNSLIESKWSYTSCISQLMLWLHIKTSLIKTFYEYFETLW